MKNIEIITNGIVKVNDKCYHYRYTQTSADGLYAVYAELTRDGYGETIVLKKKNLLKAMSSEDIQRILFPVGGKAKVYEGYTQDGEKVSFLLDRDDSHLYVRNEETNETEQYNDERYDGENISLIRQSLLQEYRDVKAVKPRYDLILVCENGEKDEYYTRLTGGEGWVSDSTDLGDVLQEMKEIDPETFENLDPSVMCYYVTDIC